jgi:hypothetical protein
MRHDVDVSLATAVEMAEVEYSRGVRATYFVMCSCEHYNPLSRIERDRIRRLVDLGHEVGLHYDPSVWSSPDYEFINEVNSLREITGRPVLSAARHLPNEGEPFDPRYVDHDAYSARLAERFTYVSDSSMRWRDRTVLDLIGAGVDIQFLSHPIWWFEDGITAHAKLMSAVEHAHGERTRSMYAFSEHMQSCLARPTRWPDGGRSDVSFSSGTADSAGSG